LEVASTAWWQGAGGQAIEYEPRDSDKQRLGLHILASDACRYSGVSAWNSWRALPQGACTSPALSNLAARRLDARLHALTSKLGYVYTRYADDLTFSGDGALQQRAGWLLSRVRHIAADEGFAVNEEKTRIQRRHTRQEVTGIVVNDKPSIDRETIRRLRAILHGARTTGLAAQNRENRPNFESWVRGMVAYIRMVNPGQGQKLEAALKVLDH
jgi:retron-type reverse transcriptase